VEINVDQKVLPWPANETVKTFVARICEHKTFLDCRLSAVTGVNNESRNVKTDSLPGFTFSRCDKVMDFQIKLFSWPDRGNHLIIITRGVLDIKGIEQIFQELVTATEPLGDCKVVVDLQDTTCNLAQADIRAFVDGFKPERLPATNKIAIVAPREMDQYDQLFSLTGGLAKRGSKIAIFYDSKAAVSWLADTI
jgi:hypothetical protein